MDRHDAKRTPLIRALAGALLALQALATEALAAEALPKLGADLAATSVSGLSSGAYMAGQIQVAHSSQIVGAGVVAGGPYACAETEASLIFPFWPTAVAQNAAQALYACMKTTAGEPDPVRSAKRAKDLAEDGEIDPVAGLAADNVYLFSGNEDQTVTRPVVKAAEQFYKEVGVDPGNVTLVEGEGDPELDLRAAGRLLAGAARAVPGVRPRALHRARRRLRRGGRGLSPVGLPAGDRLPRPYRAAWLRAVPRDRRRRL
ncbi:MAG: hypothetical protein ACRECM_04630, partial [Methyloceanibacter sp.]